MESVEVVLRDAPPGTEMMEDSKLANKLALC